MRTRKAGRMPNNDKCCLIFCFWFEFLPTESCLDNKRFQVKGLQFDTKPYHLTRHESAANAECLESFKLIFLITFRVKGVKPVSSYLVLIEESN